MVAALRPEVYRWLADREPDLLLTANLATATDEQRRMLGRELLRQLDDDEPPLPPLLPVVLGGNGR